MERQLVFEILRTNANDPRLCSIKHRLSGKFIDHDGKLRSDDPNYAGVWKNEQAAVKFLTTKKALSQYFSTIGKSGGDKNKSKGKEYFSKIGELGAKKRWSK